MDLHEIFALVMTTLSKKTHFLEEIEEMKAKLKHFGKYALVHFSYSLNNLVQRCWFSVSLGEIRLLFKAFKIATQTFCYFFRNPLTFD